MNQKILNKWKRYKKLICIVDIQTIFEFIVEKQDIFKIIDSRTENIEWNINKVVILITEKIPDLMIFNYNRILNISEVLILTVIPFNLKNFKTISVLSGSKLNVSLDTNTKAHEKIQTLYSRLNNQLQYNKLQNKLDTPEILNRKQPCKVTKIKIEDFLDPFMLEQLIVQKILKEITQGTSVYVIIFSFQTKFYTESLKDNLIKKNLKVCHNIDEAIEFLVNIKDTLNVLVIIDTGAFKQKVFTNLGTVRNRTYSLFVKHKSLERKTPDYILKLRESLCSIKTIGPYYSHYYTFVSSDEPSRFSHGLNSEHDYFQFKNFEYFIEKQNFNLAVSKEIRSLSEIVDKETIPLLAFIEEFEGLTGNFFNESIMFDSKEFKDIKNPEITKNNKKLKETQKFNGSISNVNNHLKNFSLVNQYMNIFKLAGICYRVILSLKNANDTKSIIETIYPDKLESILKTLDVLEFDIKTDSVYEPKKSIQDLRVKSVFFFSLLKRMNTERTFYDLNCSKGLSFYETFDKPENDIIICIQRISNKVILYV